MANSSNKHKTQGVHKQVKKASTWTPEKVKAAIAVIVVLVIVGIGIACYMYVNAQQDSIVGAWTCSYTSEYSDDAFELTYVFNEDKSCEIYRVKNGDYDALLTGEYDIDEKYDNGVGGYTVVLSVGTTDEDITQQYFAYTCKKDKLEMTQIMSNTNNTSKYDCTKLSDEDTAAVMEKIEAAQSADSTEASDSSEAE